MNNGNTIYVLKDEYLADSGKFSEANSKLTEIVERNKKQLISNEVLGLNGKYEIKGKFNKEPKSSGIGLASKFDSSMFILQNVDLVSDVNKKETLRQRTNLKGEPTIAQYDELDKQLSELQQKNIVQKTDSETGKKTIENRNIFYIFNSPTGTNTLVNDNNNSSNTFGSVVDSISLSIKKVKEQIETDLTEALSNYLKSQTQFQDYDFDGSNLSVLLDILSYNTYMNNFYTNMAISETFLDLTFGCIALSACCT